MSKVTHVDSIINTRLGVLLIVLGILFSVDNYLNLSIMPRLWPVLVFILGAGFLGIYRKQRYRGILFLSIGAYLIMFSLLALYLNFTSWRNLSYLWPLFLSFFGLVLIAQFFVYEQRRITLFLGLLFFLISVFFFLVFSVSGQYWWSVFILLGLSFLLSGLKNDEKNNCIH